VARDATVLDYSGLGATRKWSGVRSRHNRRVGGSWCGWSCTTACGPGRGGPPGPPCNPRLWWSVSGLI